MQLNYWEQESFFKNIDVAIIGSGIVGLSAAIHLKEQEPNLRVLILERGCLPSGASTRNAGFACFGSVTELLDDLSELSENEVVELVDLRWRGLQKLRARVTDARLDFHQYGAYELFKDDTIFEACKDKVNYFNKLLKPITQVDNTFVVASEKTETFGFQGISNLILNTFEGQLHTGKMVATLLEIAKGKGVQFLNGVKVQSIEDQSDCVGICLENAWQIQAQKVLVATNGFAKELFPNLALEPARNQVLITKPIPNLKLKGCFFYDKGYVYFRNVGNRVLLGGGRNLNPENEATSTFGFSDQIQNYLLDLMKTHFLPDQFFEVDTWWSGIMGVGTTRMPILEKASENVVLSVRLGGMGVAIGSIIGERGADLILE